MKILIVGYKGWTNPDMIKDALQIYMPSNPTICYYLQPGASMLGMKVALELGLTVEQLPDDSIEGVNLLLAFHPYIRKSKSTKSIISKASAASIPYNTFGSHF